MQAIGDIRNRNKAWKSQMCITEGYSYNNDLKYKGEVAAVIYCNGSSMKAVRSNGSIEL